jgi:hypothetical protein
LADPALPLVRTLKRRRRRRRRRRHIGSLTQSEKWQRNKDKVT